MVQVDCLVTTLMVVVSCVHVRASPTGLVPGGITTHQAMLDTEANYVLFWTPRDRDIVFEVHVATTGYVGLGFSPGGGMKDADIILGWVKDDTGEDRFSPGYGIPIIDKSQNVELLSGYQNGTHTVLRFKRPWDTCDHEDFKIANDTVRIIWSYSYQDPEGEMDMTIHHKRGTKSMYLNEPPFLMPELPQDVKTFDILVNNVSLPNTINTVYWCKVYKMQPLEKKAHIIGFVPLVQKENIEHVHHIVFYECHLPESEDMDEWLEVDGVQCYSKNMPPSWKYCKVPLLAWAVGSEGEMYPEHVGFPIGENHGGSSYFLMEMHYDNANLRQDVVDNSGLRIFYTEKVRKYDAANVALGHNVSPRMIIPPGQTWLTVGHCVSECTEMLPPEGIKVFHGLLHSHILGRSLRLRHIRNGRELPTILEDKAYDFDFQQNRVLKKEMTILPGDSLMMECVYDSTKIKTPSYGGLSTEEEMCLAFLAFYPRMEFAFCGSQLPIKSIYESVGFEEIYSWEDMRPPKKQEGERAENLKPPNKTSKYEVFKAWHSFKMVKAKSPKKYEGMTLYDVFNNESLWFDNEWVGQFQEMAAYGKHEVICARGLKDFLKHGNHTPSMTDYPDFIPFEEDNPVCSSQ
ncbi:MOXD1 homolog 1-like isoform X2 [Macrobrachium nipponense]|uniref:MOXD1 homolog 1-like isoform X2 n=1 Tax=Macrobrachium nipponense TaxID=159736 RepID=UPI0030C7F5E6